MPTAQCCGITFGPERRETTRPPTGTTESAAAGTAPHRGASAASPATVSSCELGKSAADGLAGRFFSSGSETRARLPFGGAALPLPLPPPPPPSSAAAADAAAARPPLSPRAASPRVPFSAAAPRFVLVPTERSSPSSPRTHAAVSFCSSHESWMLRVCSASSRCAACTLGPDVASWSRSWLICAVDSPDWRSRRLSSTSLELRSGGMRLIPPRRAHGVFGCNLHNGASFISQLRHYYG